MDRCCLASSARAQQSVELAVFYSKVNTTKGNCIFIGLMKTSYMNSRGCQLFKSKPILASKGLGKSKPSILGKCTMDEI